MPGPYYMAWDGHWLDHPSHDCTPDEIESIKTVEDVRRLFPDYGTTTDPKKVVYSAGTPREFRTPEALAKLHVEFVKKWNPYTYYYWWQVWHIFPAVRAKLRAEAAANKGTPSSQS